jgi:hypothetical protein
MHQLDLGIHLLPGERPARWGVERSRVVPEARWDSAPSGRLPGFGRGSAAYVLCVGAVAAWGFYTDTTATILFAVLLAMPAGGPALVGYYMAYGLLAGVSGANPDVASSGGRCTASGGCESFSTGEPAEWFLHTMDLVGALALTAAAVLNVVLLRMLNAMFRKRKESRIHLPQ